jgi:hypothetical protein
MYTGLWLENLSIVCFEDLCVNGRIMLKRVLKKRNMMGWCLSDLCGWGMRPLVGFCEEIMNPWVNGECFWDIRIEIRNKCEIHMAVWSKCTCHILCLVDCASRIVFVQWTNTMHCFSLYFINHASSCSGSLVAHHQDVASNCLRACPGPQTVALKEQPVWLPDYIHLTSWWWATNEPKTCRSMITK